MSEQDLKQDQEVAEDQAQLDEFKASMGDPSEVPEPTSTTAAAPGPSKDQGDKEPPKQGSSEKPKMPPEVKNKMTKMGMINAMVKMMGKQNKDKIMSAMNYMSKEGMMPKGMMNSMMMPKPMNSMKKVPMSSGMHPEKKMKMGEDAEYKVTAQDVDIKDDVKALFNEEDLSNDFKEKAATIFESVVVNKINEHIEVYTETVNSSYKDDVQAIKEEMAEKIDGYLDYVVEEWAENNKLAVEQGLKSELTEDFMKGLRNLFEEHYIDVPEEKVDVVEELAAKNEELQGQLNTEMEKNIEIKKALEENQQDKIVDQVAEGLSDTQKEKFKTLAEGVEFSDNASYEKKLNIIRESYFTEDNKKEVSQIVGETDEPLDVVEAQPSGSMAGYVSAISRSIKK